MPIGGVAHSCGYHDPVDLARGMLNWVYPNSLYVRTAVWQAEDAGILPKRASEPSKDLFAYHRIAIAMRSFGELMAKANIAPGEMQGRELGLIRLYGSSRSMEIVADHLNRLPLAKQESGGADP
jgi:hypothetical protein